MERIKPKKTGKLAVIFITVILFLIPFLWLKPGQMDLGGDSSRLYFYNPLSYLFSSTLYGITASGLGVENINYVAMPFILLLAFFRHFFSATTVISGFHGIELSLSFLFVYLITYELIQADGQTNSKISKYAAILAGLAYAFSPALIDGWEHVLITRNQIFLNPLMFFLLFRYFKTTKFKYILIAILLSFVFSPNFSVIAAPPFFAFYPLSILFLFVYTKLILKKKINLKHIFIGILLFVGLQSFHLIPQIVSVFSLGTNINSTVFSDSSKFVRGLEYFQAVAKDIKLSTNLLALPQSTGLNLFALFFISFPLIILVSFLYNKGKSLLILTSFFLIALFFATANITQSGRWFYESLFNIPGFSMFRNFYGQWQFVYIFFYVILFGLSLSIVLGRLKGVRFYFLIVMLLSILLIDAVPFIKGDVIKRILWTSRNVSSVFKLDPEYQKLLDYIHNLPVEGKVLTLPLTDPSYQIIAGEDGGAYEGPSTISYLAGKKDFDGDLEFGIYKDLILEQIRNKDFENFKRLLGLLNIKYIFYNADPKVYDSFPVFPYQYVRNFFPPDQKSYQKLVKSIGLTQIKNIDNKYYVYELPDKYFQPQLFIPQGAEFFGSNNSNSIPGAFGQSNNGLISLNQSEQNAVNPAVYLGSQYYDLENDSPYFDFLHNGSDIRLAPVFVSWSPRSLVYPLIVFKENRKPGNIENDITQAEKRISELLKYGNQLSLMENIISIDNLESKWKDPDLFNAIIFRKYGYWEVNMARYEKTMLDLIDKVKTNNVSTYSSEENKALITKMLALNKVSLLDVIGSSVFSDEEKSYLYKLTLGMFNTLNKHLDMSQPSIVNSSYNLKNLSDGNYDLYISKPDIENIETSNWQVSIAGKSATSYDFINKGNWFILPGVILNKSNKEDLILNVPNPKNLILDSSWKLTDGESIDSNTNTLTLDIKKAPPNIGLVKNIPNLNSKSFYLLSFDYNSFGKNYKLNWYEKDEKKDSQFLLSNDEIIDNNLDSTNWKTFSVLIKTGDYTKSGFLQILKDNNQLLDAIYPNSNGDKIEIKNLSLSEVPNPEIYLRSTAGNENNESLPTISFKRVNSTKYLLNIKNAKKPFTLVFAEGFNSKWRLIDSNTNINSFNGFIQRLSGKFGSFLTGFFVNNKGSKNFQIASYDGGKLIQENNNDIFLNKNTFITWGKQEVAGRSHFQVNGYANAWYITPEDVNGKTNYDLVLEMDTQKIFYVSLFISLVTLILSLVLLIMSIAKHNENKK